MRIHDPDVVYTDLGLAILGAFFRVAVVEATNPNEPNDEW
jgi:hypothetical protein